jgi:hypothetical protein
LRESFEFPHGRVEPFRGHLEKFLVGFLGTSLGLVNQPENVMGREPIRTQVKGEAELLDSLIVLTPIEEHFSEIIVDNK